jgi:Tfp pilus assembly protein PilN
VGITISIPLAVIIAAVSTVMVWRSFEYQPKNSSLLTNSIKELEQRISNLGIICSDQKLDLQRRIKQLKSKD